MLAALLTLMSIFANQVFAKCSRSDDGIVTGGACSIAELNEQIRQSHQSQQGINDFSSEKNIIKHRTRFFSQSQSKECAWGPCLIKNIYK